MGDFADVVHEAVEHPLEVDLVAASQGEAVHAFACLDVAEDRFDNGHSLGVGPASLRGVDLAAHLVGGSLPKAAKSREQNVKQQKAVNQVYYV